MTLDEIRRRVEVVLRVAHGDPESAHIEDDNLRQDVLEGIRDGSIEDPAAAAAIALETGDIERWYA